MRRTWILLSILIVLAAIVVACASPSGKTGSPSGPGYGILSPAQLASMLQQKSFAFVNVHIPYEGEIGKTDAFIAYDEIDKHLNQFPADKTAKIVLYCRSGHMSSIAAAELVKLGYTNVSHLDGGMVAWEAAGYQVIQR